MKGALYRTPPPGLLTSAQVAKALDMSRANFHAKYAQALDRWQFGPGKGTLLFRKEDVANLARWCEVRRGMIVLGHWHPNTPGLPTEDDFHAAVHEGYWDGDCPKCEGEAVGVTDDDDRVWCPNCDK